MNVIKFRGKLLMAENIRFYPKAYTMSEELKCFFTEVTNNSNLQEQLYATKKLSDVAKIAKQIGFNIKAAEILQAQAGRVLAILEDQSDDVQNLISGIKPKTGAQWGRGGGGYLDRVGYWLSKLSTQHALTETEKVIKKFMVKVELDVNLKNKLLNTKTFNDLAQLFHSCGFTISALDLLAHQAQKILALSESDANRVAEN